MLVFPAGASGRTEGVGRFSAREEQEVCVYFSHFLTPAPQVSSASSSPAFITALKTHTHFQQVGYSPT